MSGKGVCCPSRTVPVKSTVSLPTVATICRPAEQSVPQQANVGQRLSHAELRSRFQIRHECLVRNRWRLLESTRSLGWTNWQRAVEALTTNNGRLEVTAPFDEPGRFFRLRKP